MPNNLDFDVVAKTDKARVELTLLQAELKKTTAELKKAGEAGDKTRVTALSSAYNTLQREIIQTSRAVTQQNRALVGHGLAAAGAARGLHALAGAHKEAGEAGKVNVREIVKISKELGSLEVSGFGVAKMFKELPAVAVPVAVAAGVAAAAVKMAELAFEAAKTVRAVEDLHDATGKPTRDILALRNTFIGVNGEAKDADAWIRRMSDDFTKAHESAAGLEGALSGIITGRGGQPGATSGMQVMRGSAIDRAGVLPAAQPSGFDRSGIVVTRGGQPMKLDVEHGLGGLIDQSQFPLSAKGQNQFQEQSLKILAEIEKTNHMLALRVAGTEMPGVQPEVALRELLAQAVSQAMEHAGELGLRPPPKDLTPGAGQMATGLQIAQKQAASAGEELQTQVGLGLMTGTTNALQGITSGLNATTDHMETTSEHWAKITEGMTEHWDDLKADIQNGVDPSVAAINWKDVWIGSITAVGNALKAAFDNSQPPGPGGQTGQVIPLAGGMATGGLVRGPGTGTSDSILARLSAGEFVVNSARVRQVGLGFMNRLNGFADGGLVPSMAFASGGLVPSAAGGRAVHLHLGSGSFALSGSESVVGALVGEANRQQMRSAGVKPSWFGGRAGGH